MIDDVRPPEPRLRTKPKRIEPLEKPVARPLHEQAKAVEPSFLTPGEMAAMPSEPVKSAVVEHQKSKAPLWKVRWPLTRKQQIAGSAAVIVLAVGLGAAWTLTHHRRTVVAETATPKTTVQKPAPQPVYSTLSGLPVADASVNQRPVTGVMIENSLDARPQSGLAEAGVVFEAVAEGGVTRFLALFQDTSPANIGPVRSARPYYVSWAMGFDAAYAHVGGSADALSDITAWGVHDMNQFSNGGSYHRVSSRDAPHNVYTSMGDLNKLESAKGYSSSYSGFPRAKDAAAATPTASSIDFALSGPTYNPHYDYAASTNSYNRSEAGSPHTDAETGKQLSPKVVIAMVVPLVRGALDASGAYYSNYTVVGTGQAYIFQNGSLIMATWTKPSNGAQITFSDAAGNPVALNRGQTWITAVSASNQVTYK